MNIIKTLEIEGYIIKLHLSGKLLKAKVTAEILGCPPKHLKLGGRN